MLNDAKYIGLDVHQATISVVVLDGIGHLVMESVIETKAATILQLLHGLSGSLHVTFEEGTCAAWLHDLLKPHVAKVVVCDPRKNALLKAGNKNDRIDARKLADLLRSRAALRGLPRGERRTDFERTGPQLSDPDARYHAGDEPLKSPL
jgi:transposase